MLKALESARRDGSRPCDEGFPAEELQRLAAEEGVEGFAVAGIDGNEC